MSNEEISNVARASALVVRELHQMALEIADPRDQELAFDPRNRDLWMDAFIARLKARYQKPDRIASND